MASPFEVPRVSRPGPPRRLDADPDILNAINAEDDDVLDRAGHKGIIGILPVESSPEAKLPDEERSEFTH